MPRSSKNWRFHLIVDRDQCRVDGNGSTERLTDFRTLCGVHKTEQCLIGPLASHFFFLIFMLCISPVLLRLDATQKKNPNSQVVNKNT